MTEKTTLRVAQVATGNIGSRALLRVIEHPELELVAVQVHNRDKAGIDAGLLAGGTPVGIAAVTETEDVIAADPHCVLYMAQTTDIDAIVRLLESGINIVTTRHDFHNPALMDPAVRERVKIACRAGESTIYSTGSSPGFSTEALPLVLASLTRRIDHMEIQEFADLSSRASPEMILGGMGFGKVPSGANLKRLEHLKASFGPSLAMTANSMGLAVDSLAVEGSLAVALHDTEIAAGMVKAGTVAAQRNRVLGLSGDRTVISFTATWFVTDQIEPLDDTQWFLRASGWRIVVHGDTPLDVNIEYPVDPGAYSAFTPNLTAHRPVNAIAAVCAASPGIATTADLPLILPQLIGADRHRSVLARGNLSTRL